ncbi:pecanex-related protein [Schistosoma mansoni]|uniref:pecanex-related protein n=1 Tax=Schistosoma mansoni TaxID=6183 RepID=UPI00022C82C8|nr:pecanex-related protein [Schistosoma mansoni]|eukprot:XP_018646017.1 pecanex-related protein [Schistosoma mansoni]
MIPVIFKEGIIASLTGGFYFDSSQTHFANIIHVYVWIILFVIPLILYMISVKSHITALLYGFSIGSFVLIVKLVIWRLHDLLDKSDPVDNSQKANKAYSKKQLSTRHQTGVHEDGQEHFQDINDIENKCRRIGIAGLELADLRDSTLNHVCHFTDSEITVGSAIQNTHILNDKGICKYEPLENYLGSDLAFSDSFTDSITFPVSSFQLGPSASRLNYVTIEQSSSCSNGDSLVPDLCAVEEEKQSTENNKLNPSNSNCALSSNNSNQICKSETITSGLLKSTTSSTSAETKNTDFAQNLNARTVKPIYVNTPLKSFSGRNGRRAPVRRQFSETAVKNAFEVQRLVTFYDQTDRVSGSQFDHFVPEITGPITGELSVDKSSRPSTSIPNRSLVRSSSVRTEIEQCKRILNQLKRDVSQLPLLPIARFTPSMKDLDTLDLNPKVLQAAPLSYVRSRSQLRRRVLFIDRDQNRRTITYLTSSGRNSIPYSTELSLSETIFFWRQCFANINFDRPVRRRHQQADIIAFNEIPLSNLNLRPRRLPRGWRSHSLRYDLAAMKPFAPHPRQLVRRPGTAVCLQRQESAGSTSSAVVKSSPLQFSTPERKTIQFSVSDSHDSTGSDIVEAITLDSQRVQNDPDNIPVDAERLASKCPVSSSNPLDEVQPSTQSHDLNEKVDEYVEKKVKDIEITSLSNHLSDDGFTVNLQTPITHPLDESSSNKIANDHYNVESNKSLLTKTRGSNRLTRQAGFRRRPAMSSGSHSQSKGVTSLKNEKATSSRDNHLHTEVTKEIKRSDVDSTLQTSSSVSKPISTNPISVDQAVDDLLAHLMGVKSLADTGLTRQQCLFQLRGNGNTEDSENAEWDILYAVTEAATDNSTVIPEPAETITTNITAITTTDTTSQTDDQPAQFRSTNSETKNCDDIYQDGTFNNLDEDSWDLQEISIKACCPSTNENQEVGDEINTQEAVANRSNDSGSDDNGGNNSSSNSLLWFFRKGFRPSKLQQQQQQHRPLSTAPIHTISLSSCFPFTFRFQLNRLELGYIFDKSFTTMEIILCSILAALVSIIGYYTLRTASFQDYGPLACFTIAGCHYSLMKSVQPDPASPKHGFNRLIVFTRSFLFCSCASIYLLADYLYQPQKSVPFSGVMSNRLTYIIKYSSIYVLLIFPILFCLGLMPQINTVLIYALEQLDIHVFGASGTTGLFSVILSIFRTFIVIGLTFVPCYYSVQKSDPQCMLFSIFWGIQIALCFLLSKDNSRVTTEQYQTTDSKITQSQFENNDPLSNLIRISLLARFENDLLSCILWFILAFLSHLTITIITSTNTTINSTDFHSYYYCYILNWISIVLGFLLHYVWPNFRKPYPWLLLVKPVVEPDLHGRIIRWEVAYFWLCWLERNLFLPAITMCTVTQSFDSMAVKFGPLLSTFIIIVCSMKMLRNGFCCAKQTYLSLFFTNLLFSFDFYNFKEAFPINYFFVSLLVSKFIELFRKLHFIYVYLAPFNIIWGSVAHAVVQLGSIPHSVFLFANCIFSTILSAPLEPFMASAIFITSYVRPICFWETNHRTQRIETTNMPIAAQLKGISKHQVSGNLDGIFYEHLTRKLQRTLAGDLQLGRIGGLSVQHGDVFILSTDDLNLLVHIIEVGNGFVTYQLRGLEFIGTLCHASESEALRSDPHKSKRFCCCHSKTIHGMLSFNTAVRLRCMTWQFAYTPYIVEGYEVTDHSAGLTFQLTDLRKVLISRFVHCIIYFVCKLPNLSNRLTQLTPCLDSNRFLSPDYFDLDPVFFKAIDDDFDEDVSGVTKQRFIQIYSDWIAYCLKKQSGNSSVPCGPDSPVVSLCLALSLLGRRCMGGQQSSKPILDQFLHGVHQVFAGDINLVPRDDWVLVDLDLLQTVVTPSVRIALKLYQDTFTWSSGNTHSELYKKIVYTEKNVVICPETDPKWRFAVLNDADCLFSFRWVSGRTSMDVYRIVQLTKRRLEFRAIKLNPECVRGLWAGQQREQIFLRNNNEERGSIQSANPVLRNLVNSSCDPPIGYPIYVSPLITSFAGDNDDYINVSGGELSFVSILLRMRGCWRRFRQLCGCKKEKCDGQIECTANLSLFTRCNTSQQLKKNVSSTTYNKSNAQLTLSTYPSTSNDNDNLGKWSSKQVDCNEETTLIALIHQQNDLDNITGGILSSTTNKYRENRHFDHICCSIEQLYKNRQQVIILQFRSILSYMIVFDVYSGIHYKRNTWSWIHL